MRKRVTVKKTQAPKHTDKHIEAKNTEVLRFEFARAALSGLTVGRAMMSDFEQQDVAALAWKMADLMMSQRTHKVWK